MESRRIVSMTARGSAPRPGYWGCKICEVDMPLSSRIPHLNGKRHAQKNVELDLVEITVNPLETMARVEMPEKVKERGVGEKGEEMKRESEAGGEGEGNEEGDEGDEEDSDDEEEEEEEEKEYGFAGVKGWAANVEQLIDLDAMAQGDWTEMSNQNLSSISWRCITCDETMSIFFKDEHLTGKTHAKMLRKQTQAQSPRATPDPIIPSSMIWRCMICDETMNVFYKDEHLSGKGHTKSLRVRGLSPDPVISRDLSESAYWTPDDREAEADEVNDDHPDDEILSSPPIEEVKVTPDDLTTKQEVNPIWDPTAKWICTTCSISMEIDKKEDHLASLAHIMKCDCSACTQYKLDAVEESSLADVERVENVQVKEKSLKNGPTEESLKPKTETSNPTQPSSEQAEIPPSGENARLSFNKARVPKPGMFICRICDAEFMLEDKWMHLSIAWECKTCGKWLHHDWKDRHLENHDKKARRAKSREMAKIESTTLAQDPATIMLPPAALSPSVEEYYCPVCRKNLTMMKKKRHGFGAWHCTVCSLTLHILEKDQDMVCRMHSRSQGSNFRGQNHGSQFSGDSKLVGETETKPNGLIDLLSDDINIPIPEFSSMPQRANQSFIDNDRWSRMFGESAAGEFPKDIDLPDETPEVELKLEDPFQDPDGYASAIEIPPDHESLHVIKDHSLQQIEEIEDSQLLEEDKTSFETSSLSPEDNDRFQSLHELESNAEGVLEQGPTQESQNDLPYRIVEAEDTQLPSEQVENAINIPNPTALATFRCAVCKEKEFSIDLEKYHRGGAWECQVCDKTMHRGSRTSHLAGAKHKMRELKKCTESLGAAQPKTISTTPITSVIPVIPIGSTGWSSGTPKKPVEIDIPTLDEPEIFFCEPCNKMIKTKYKKIHKGREWKCDVCDITIHIPWKNGHINGSKHIKRQEKALLINAATTPNTSV